MKWRRIRRGYCLLEYASISNTNLHSFVDAAVATPAHGNTHDPLVPYASFRVFLCSTTNRRDDRCFQSLLSFYSNRTENKTNEGGTQVPETYTAATKITTCLQLGELPSYHRIRNSNRRLGIVLPYTDTQNHMLLKVNVAVFFLDHPARAVDSQTCEKRKYPTPRHMRHDPPPK